MKFSTLFPLILFFTAALVPGPADARKPRRDKVTSIILNPSGGSMRPGDTALATAVGLNSEGEVVPAAVFKFKSNRPGVLSIDSTGRLTAVSPGTARIVARTKGKKAKVDIAVTVEPAQYVAQDLLQVNHIAVDAASVYWTEFGFKEVRVRRVARTGGLIYDLAREPATDRRGVSVTYAQLRLNPSQLFWSRETAAFLDHWSIRTQGPGGGYREILPEDISVEPMLINTWAATAGHVVAVLEFPALLGLPPATRVAAYDLATGIWSPLVTTAFDRKATHVIAADNRFVYIRAVQDGTANILKVDPQMSVDSYTTIHSSPGADSVQRTSGAIDASNLYFWSSDGGSSLMSLSLSGGAPVRLAAADGAGLATDGAYLYWVTGDDVVLRMPAAGGPTEVVTRSILRVSTTGGLAVDNGTLFIAEPAPRSYRIRALTP